MHVSQEDVWEMWWVSTARHSLIRGLLLSDSRLSGCQKQRCITWLWSICHNQIALLIFWQCHLESSDFSIPFFLSLPSPLPCPWKCKFTTFVDSVMRRWVSVTPLLKLPLLRLAAFWNICCYLYRPVKGLFVISCHLFNSNSHLSQAGFISAVPFKKLNQAFWNMDALCFCWIIQTANLLKPSEQSFLQRLPYCSYCAV